MFEVGLFDCLDLLGQLDFVVMRRATSRAFLSARMISLKFENFLLR